MLQAENILFTAAMLVYFAAMIFFFVFVTFKKELLSKIGEWLLFSGLTLHTAALICRGIGAGRLPMTNQYEFAASFAWGICLVSLIFIRKYRYAAMQNREVHALMPALQSRWLGFHVSTAIIAYGAFGVAFVISGIFLMRAKMKDQGFFDRHTPNREKLDLISYRSVCLGLLFLTFTIITGAIWAQRAWGSYWSWDPKETWSLVTWLVYAVYLHLRLRRGWRGKSAAIFAVAGFLCVIFTYIGVNTLLPGIHSYA